MEVDKRVVHTHRRENEKIMEPINMVYSIADTEKEKNLRKQSMNHYTRLLKAEKW